MTDFGKVYEFHDSSRIMILGPHPEPGYFRMLCLRDGGVLRPLHPGQIGMVAETALGVTWIMLEIGPKPSSAAYDPNVFRGLPSILTSFPGGTGGTASRATAVVSTTVVEDIVSGLFRKMLPGEPK